MAYRVGEGKCLTNAMLDTVSPTMQRGTQECAKRTARGQEWPQFALVSFIERVRIKSIVIIIIIINA